MDYPVDEFLDEFGIPALYIDEAGNAAEIDVIFDDDPTDSQVQGYIVENRHPIVTARMTDIDDATNKCKLNIYSYWDAGDGFFLTDEDGLLYILDGALPFNVIKTNPTETGMMQLELSRD